MQCTALVTLPMETGVAIGVYNVLDSFTDNEEYEILSATPQHRAELYCLFVSLVARREHVPRIANFAEFVIPQYSAGNFKAHLRISTETYEKVVELISEDLAAEYNGLTPCLTLNNSSSMGSVHLPPSVNWGQGLCSLCSVAK